MIQVSINFTDRVPLDIIIPDDEGDYVVNFGPRSWPNAAGLYAFEDINGKIYIVNAASITYIEMSSEENNEDNS